MELTVILHDIRSVHNVGSIFRTADAAGVAKIYCCGITPAPLDRFKHVRADFAKVSLGAENSVAWESAKSTADIVNVLKEDGWKIFAVEQSPSSVPYFDAEIVPGDAAGMLGAEARVALIVGNEVEGLPVSLLTLADETLEIPMHGKKESLNVAVAFGIVVFDLVRRGKIHGSRRGTI